MKNKVKESPLLTLLLFAGAGGVLFMAVLWAFSDPFECGVDTVVDADGNVYETVAVGGRCWTAENVRTTRFSDGRDISRPESNSAWREAGNEREGAYACYNGEEEHCDTYGALYNVYAVAEGLCPKGWYVPTDGDFKDLERTLGMNEEETDLLYWRGSDQATALAGEAHLWRDESVGESDNFNETGFSAVPAGYRVRTGVDSGRGHRAHFWSSTIHASGWRRTLAPGNTGQIRRTAAAKNIGFSVRCIQE